MNELEAIKVLINGQPFDMYFKDDVDEAIAELKEFVQDAKYFKNLAESYHKRWMNAKNELDAYKLKEEQNEV